MSAEKAATNVAEITTTVTVEMTREAGEIPRATSTLHRTTQVEPGTKRGRGQALQRAMTASLVSAAMRSVVFVTTAAAVGRAPRLSTREKERPTGVAVATARQPRAMAEMKMSSQTSEMWETPSRNTTVSRKRWMRGWRRATGLR